MHSKTIYLLRHGDTNLPGRYIGVSDVPVSSKGIEQVIVVGRSFKKENIELLLSSPLRRCRETTIALDLSCRQKTDKLLQEVDFGSWEGKNFEQIHDSDPELVKAWLENPGNFSFPDGENLANFRKRIVRIKEMLCEQEERKILLVTHGGVIRHLLCCLLGISFDHFLAFDVKPGTFATVVMHSGIGVLTGFNLIEK